MLIHPIQVSEQYPIGSVIESNCLPNSDWLLCNGQLLLQSEYSILFSLMERPHPIFQHWKMIDSGAGNYFDAYEIIYANNLWVGSCYSSKMIYSSNGENWSLVPLTTASRYYYSLAYNGTVFVSVPYSPSTAYTLYATSTNGVTWIEGILPTAVAGRRVTYDGTYFFIAHSAGCLRSSDGYSWSALTGIPVSVRDGASSLETVILAGSSGDVAVSYDHGSSWKHYNAINTLWTGNFNYILEDDIFVVNNSGYNTMIYSISDGNDGINWKLNKFFIDDYRNSDVHRIKKAGNYYFVCNGNSDTLLYSSDLKIWEKSIVPKGYWRDIIYNSSTGCYYILGDGRHILKWKEVNYDTNTYFELPLANSYKNYNHMSNKMKYIRVK